MTDETMLDVNESIDYINERIRAEFTRPKFEGFKKRGIIEKAASSIKIKGGRKHLWTIEQIDKAIPQIDNYVRGSMPIKSESKRKEQWVDSNKKQESRGLSSINAILRMKPGLL